MHTKGQRRIRMERKNRHESGKASEDGDDLHIDCIGSYDSGVMVL